MSHRVRIAKFTSATALTQPTRRCSTAPLVTGKFLTRCSHAQQHLAGRPAERGPAGLGGRLERGGNPPAALLRLADRVEAGKLVPGVSPDQLRLILAAMVGRVPAARGEPAGRRRAGQVRRYPGNRVQPLLGLRRLVRQRMEQRLGVGVPGVIEQRRGAGRLDDLARVHHRDPVRPAGDHPEVVGHQDDRHPQPQPQVVDQLEDLLLDGDVQGGRRLVGDQQLRLAGQRHRDHHPLPHTAGELVRVLGDPFPGPWHARPGQAPRRPGPGPAPWWRRRCSRTASAICLPTVMVGFSEVSGSWKIMPISLPRTWRMSWSESVLISRPLELDAAAGDRPAGRQQVHDRQRGHRLAAARLAHDAQRLARVNVERHAVDRVHDPLLEPDLGAQVSDLK